MINKQSVFTVKDIVNRNKPILHIVHDNDGEWQFLTGENVLMENILIVTIEQIITIDSSVTSVLNMVRGSEATRIKKESEWRIFHNG